MSDQSYTPVEDQLLRGIVCLAAVFAEALEAELPGLRGRLELAATREQMIRNEKDEDLHVQTLLLLFLRELHNQSLVGKT